MSNAAIALSAAIRSFWRNSAAMIPARADPAVDFKRCCMLSGEFDGSDRDYFFQIGDAALSRLAPGR